MTFKDDEELVDVDLSKNDEDSLLSPEEIDDSLLDDEILEDGLLSEDEEEVDEFADIDGSEY